MEFSFGLSTLLVTPLYISCLLAIIVTLFYRIEVGIFFIIPFVAHQNILNYFFQFPLGKDINDLLFIAMLIRWVIDKRKAGDNIFVKSPLNVPMMLLIIWSYLEVWWGARYFGDPAPLSLGDPRIIYWKNLILLPLLFLIILNNIKNPKHMKIIILLMILAVLLLDRNFYSVARWRDFSHYSDNQRVGSIMASLGGNELAVCMAMYAIVLVSFFIYLNNIWLKLFLLLPIGASYYCIAFSFSRSGYLATVIGWAVVGLLKDRKILVVLIALVFFWQVLLPVAVKERIEMTKTDEGYDETVLQRFGMWEMGKDIIFSNPILGAGLNATQSFNITADGIENRVWHSFHNSYLQQAVETGIPGLGIYLWIFFFMLRIGWRLFRTTDDWFQKSLGLGLLACVFSCLAGNIAGGYWNYFSVNGYMYAIAGLVMRCLVDSENVDESAVSFSVQDLRDEKSY